MGEQASGMANPQQYLEWHGQQWRVVIFIPRNLHDILGRTRLKQALGTADLKEANERKWAVVTRMKAVIAQAQGDLKAGIGIDPSSLKEILFLARQEIERSTLAVEHKEEFEDAIIVTEREAAQTVPDQGRIGRLVKTIGKKAAEFGLPLAQKAAEEWLRQKGLIA